MVVQGAAWCLYAIGYGQRIVYIPTPCAESVQLQMVRPDSASKGLDEALRSLAYCGTARGMSLRGDTWMQPDVRFSTCHRLHRRSSTSVSTSVVAEAERVNLRRFGLFFVLLLARFLRTMRAAD